ncbi:ABC transporter ATP-binding protein [[Mycoplasma] testudinis]|uniref:ABC transporter ATP-binding protein n=1 Tax=[Mycoplasma] testudinis TaxID=33924 RepID=UPI0006990199|nr:ABC transporter ATP-binding protein [[Mycoplasma] testudinis]
METKNVFTNQNIDLPEEETVVVSDFPFFEDKWERPAEKIVRTHEEFIKIASAYLGLVANYFVVNLKKLEATFGSKAIAKINFQASRISAELAALKKTLQNKYQQFAVKKADVNVFTKDHGDVVYSVFNFIKIVDEKSKILIELVNEFIDKHKGVANRLKYAKSQEEYLLIVNTEFENLYRHFNTLEENVAKDEAIPLKYLAITQKNAEARKKKILALKANATSLKPHSYRDPKTKKVYEFGLVKFYKLYDRLKIREERIFWLNEVNKVNILNKPHKNSLLADVSQHENIIDLQNVIKYYSNGVTTTKVLKGVNLQIPSGEFVVILGPSGSGKTTLLNIISGMDRASSGKSIVAGENLLSMSDTKLTDFRRRNVGYIFQQYGLLPNLTVRENIEIGAHLQSNAALRLNIDDLLKEIGMYEHRNRLPAELSGGQQQRVSIARAISKNPKIVFGDEPTGALDEEMTQVVLQQFVEINKKHKTTLIVVTHNPLIAEIATMVVRVGDGIIKSVNKNPNPKSVHEVKWSGD